MKRQASKYNPNLVNNKELLLPSQYVAVHSVFFAVSFVIDDLGKREERGKREGQRQSEKCMLACEEGQSFPCLDV